MMTIGVGFSLASAYIKTSHVICPDLLYI